MNQDLLEAISRRRSIGLSQTDVAGPEHVAAQTQPTELPPIPTATGMVEHEAPETLEEEVEEEHHQPTKEYDHPEGYGGGHAPVYELLGTDNAHGLRGRAMKMAKEKK